MGHESIESQAYFDKEFPEGCKARDTQFLNEWIQRAFNAGWKAALKRAESGRTAPNRQSVPCLKCNRSGITCWPCLPFVKEEGCDLE